MMYGYGMGWGWAALMPLMWIVLIGVIVWAAIRLVQQSGRAAGSPMGTAPRHETPQEILDRRLASGEIDTETYRQMRAAIAARSSSARP